MSKVLASRILYGELVNNVASGDLSKKGIARHLQPGVVTYDNDDGTTTTYLLELDAIEAMRPTAAGIPVVGKSGNFDHVKVEPGKEYDGKVTDSFWDGESGWEAFHFDKMNAETAAACKNGYQASCAYVPTETDGIPGKWHNVPYDEKILNGRYTHVAVVPVPRYAGAKIELLNSKPGGTHVNETIKKLIKSLLPAKDLRELANAAEAEDKKKEAKDKAKLDFENAMLNAKTDDEKAKAKDAFEKANAAAEAADQPGAADEAQKAAREKELGERKNKIAALRNAGAAVEAATGDKAKAAEYHNEADKLEKLPLGGGDVPKDPGVVQAGARAEGESVEKEKAEQAALDKKNADDAAAKALAQEAEEKRAQGERANALHKILTEAWASFTGDMLDDEQIAGKVLTNSATKKPLELASQPAEVQAAWKGAYEGAAGASHAEKCNSLLVKATATQELRNAIKAKETLRQERFNALQKAAAERGGAHGMPSLGMETMEDKVALGQELYGR